MSKPTRPSGPQRAAGGPEKAPRPSPATTNPGNPGAAPGPSQHPGGPVNAITVVMAPHSTCTPAQVLEFDRQRAQKRARLRAQFGDPDLINALAAIVRNEGAPVLPIRGRSAWKIVADAEPDVFRYFRSLGTDPDSWSAVHRDISKAMKKGSEAAAREFMKAQKEAEDEGRAFAPVDGVTTQGVKFARAACGPRGAIPFVLKDWRGRGAVLADVADLLAPDDNEDGGARAADVDAPAADLDTPTYTPPPGFGGPK